MNRRQPPAFAASAAGHVLCVAAAVWLARPVPGGAGTAVTAVSAVGADAIEQQAVDPAARPLRTPPRIDPIDEEPLFRRTGDDAILTLPGFTFDYAKVAGRARSLFPFLSLRVPLDRMAPVEARPRTRLVNPFSRGASQSSLPALVLNDSALQSLVDGAWSRRERWRPFGQVAELARRYNPDSGALPTLLRRYVDHDTLQPYLDTANRDPRLWTELAIAADHRDFIDFIARYAAKHPSSKATTELMFLLEKMAQGSYDALATLVDTSSSSLDWTRAESSEAYDLLVTLHRYYRAELDLRNLTPRSALKSFYDAIRVAILMEIVKTTPDGYRESDARFLIGAIYWRQAKAAEAVSWWRDMTINPADGYVAAYSRVLSVLNSNATADVIDRGAINQILDDERGGWVEFWRRRLEQFGYRFDTY